jgi:chorismate mutase/prephenate dehydratase
MAQDGSGALLRLLEPLARRGLSLSRIQSRPTRRKLWEYAFFLDVEGHVEDPPMAEALVELQAACASLKVLGSYPQAMTEVLR